MTTKKTTTAKSSTATKAATAKKPTAKKATTKKTASKATAIAEPALVAPTVKEKLTTTVMMPEAPVTEIAMEAVVAKAEPKAPVATAPAAAPVAKKIVLTIGMLQKRLSELGAYDGAWDGVYGPMTKHAVARFQAKTGLAVNGDSNAETLAALGLDLYKTY
ncbi:putative peptidoglycan binding domain protein [compost metagenome]